jgi:predicted permease
MIFESHLLSMIVYAFFVALVLSLIRRADLKGRLRYGLLLFAVMTAGAIIFGWLMFLFIKR